MYAEITASTAQAVLSAKTRIEILIDSVRPTLPWTHFISIPLNTSNFVKQFELFKNQVTEFASEIKVSCLRVCVPYHVNHCLFDYSDKRF